MVTDTDTSREVHVQNAKSRIKTKLSRSLDLISVEVVNDPELQPEDAQPSDTDAVLLVRFKHPENDDVLGDGLPRGEAEYAMRRHVDEQLFDVDGRIIEVSVPPKRAVNQSCLFYIEVSL